jgi:cytochrome c-type biogenesis protein
MDLIALDVSGIVVDGSLLLAVPLALLAGLVSFLSPCVLPLAPGYLAYVAGLTGSDLADEAEVNLSEQQNQSLVVRAGSSSGSSGAPVEVDSPVAFPDDLSPGSSDTAIESSNATSSSRTEAAGANPWPGADSVAELPHPSSRLSDNGSADGAPVTGVGRGRVLAGASLFVLGFSVVFVSYGAAFGGLGAWLLGHSRQVSVVMGIVVVILGLGYLGLPALSNRMWWNADRRSHTRPSRGLWGAPLLGVLFGLGWTPCIGPTLAAVQTLAFTEASAIRGAVLSLAYCFGLGLPFIGMAVGLRAVAGATDWTKKHYLTISRFGGVMLISIGMLLVTGWWNDIVAWVQGIVPGFTAVI